MKPSALLPTTAVCTVLGWLLPPLWTAKEDPAPRRLALRPAMERQSSTFAAGIRKAGLPMAQLQAVVADVTGRGRSLVTGSDAFDGFACSEAAELAARLAGAELGQSVSDGASFLRSLHDLDSRVQDAAVEAWAERDPEAALRVLVTAVSDDDSSGDHEDLIHRLVERDPERALRVLQSAGPASTHTGWQALVRALAKKNIAHAFDILQSAPFGIRPRGVEAIITEFAKKDPQAALEWANGLSPEWVRDVSWNPVFEKWAESDPIAAMEAWKGGVYWDHSYPFGPNHPDFAKSWAVKDPEAAIRFASENRDLDDRESYINEGIAALAAKDPQRAAAMLDAVGEHREAAIHKLVETWGASDFPAALAWSRTLAGDERQKAFATLAESASQLTSEERLAFAREAGIETPAGFGLLWKANHAEATARYASMPPDVQRELWKGLSAPDLAEFPGEAMKMIRAALENDPPDELRDDILPELISQWSRQDPAATAAGVSELPPGDSKVLAVQNLIDSWSHYDPDGAAAWARALPDGPARDKAMEQLAATATAGGDPAAAVKWLALMQDGKKREQQLRNGFTTWSQTDPAAARAAIEALSLGPGEEERVLNPARQIPPPEEEPPPPDPP